MLQHLHTNAHLEDTSHDVRLAVRPRQLAQLPENLLHRGAAQLAEEQVADVLVHGRPLLASARVLAPPIHSQVHEPYPPGGKPCQLSWRSTLPLYKVLFRTHDPDLKHAS